MTKISIISKISKIHGAHKKNESTEAFPLVSVCLYSFYFIRTLTDTNGAFSLKDY